MKRIFFSLMLMVLGLAPLARGQGNSIILESKTIGPNLNGSPAFTVKVSITNNDSLAYFTLCLAEQTVSGSAYALLDTPRTFLGVVTPLTNSLRYFTEASMAGYNSSSPDSFLIGAGFDPNDRDGTLEPPNSVPKPVWELKFAHTSDSLGQVILRGVNGSISGGITTFTDQQPADHKNIPVTPGIITIDYPKGDLNRDGLVSPADVVEELMCVLTGSTPPAGRSFCDLNCDGEVSPADIVVMLNYKFLGAAWPC